MSAASLQIGELVGPYRIVGELGGGGMGMVYRAEHALLQRPAAIKVLRPELGSHAMASDRFLTEARATTAIRHPGIVEVYDYGHTQRGNAYIAMELLEGQTLAARLQERGRMTLYDALTITRRIAAPLAAAHERGIVHRDLKPENVFLVRDHEGGTVDRVKILDFGIAKLESTAAAHRTTLGLILGTPAYMSPEQCLGTSDCDHRADLYALGCIMFEMLSGHAPYSALRTNELFAAHIRSPVPELGRLVSVPPAIERLVRRLLAKSPADRPRDAVEVIGELDRWFAEQSYPPTRRRPSRVLVAAGGLALTLSAIGAWYRSWRAAPRVAHDAGAVSTQATTMRRPVPEGTRPAIDTSAPTTPLLPDAGGIDAPPVAERAPPADAPAATPLPRPPRQRARPVVTVPAHSPAPEVVMPELVRPSTVDVDTAVTDVAVPR